MKKKNQLLIGIALIVISFGVLYISISTIKGSFSTLWPAIVLLLGMISYIYFKIKSEIVANQGLCRDWLGKSSVAGWQAF